MFWLVFAGSLYCFRHVLPPMCSRSLGVKTCCDQANRPNHHFNTNRNRVNGLPYAGQIGDQIPSIAELCLVGGRRLGGFNPLPARGISGVRLCGRQGRKPRCSSFAGESERDGPSKGKKVLKTAFWKLVLTYPQLGWGC